MCVPTNCPVITSGGDLKPIICTAHDCKDRTTPTCAECKWHDSFSWVCFNGLSKQAAGITDPEDYCKEWEKREDDSRGENQEAKT